MTAASGPVRVLAARQAVVPIASSMRNAVISFAAMTVSVVALVSDRQRNGRPLIGFGFNSNGRYAQHGLLAERFLPRLEAAAPEALADPAGNNLDPEAARAVLMADEKPGGHGDRAVAVGVLDMALWDLVAKVEDRPLHELLAERFGPVGTPLARVPVYAAGGYYHGDAGSDLNALKEELRGYTDLGYTRCKIKIGGAPIETDLRRVDAALEVLGTGDRLAVDANGRFGLDEALRYAEVLAPYDLAWYEEPCDPLDYLGHAVVAEAYRGPLATGENLLSRQDTRNLARHGGLRPGRDVLQMDPALSYGLVEYRRVLADLSLHGWSASDCVPHGGHQFNLSIAAALGLGGVESYPGVFAPFGGFADDSPVEGGTVGLTDAPGIGLERKASLRPIMASLVGDDALAS